MSEINNLRPEVIALLLPVVVLILGSIVAIVAIWTYHMRRSRQTELEVSLKRQMVESGMTVEEIERVIKAGHEETRES